MYCKTEIPNIPRYHTRTTKTTQLNRYTHVPGGLASPESVSPVTIAISVKPKRRMMNVLVMGEYILYQYHLSITMVQHTVVQILSILYLLVPTHTTSTVQRLTLCRSAETVHQLINCPSAPTLLESRDAICTAWLDCTSLAVASTNKPTRDRGAGQGTAARPIGGFLLIWCFCDGVFVVF